MNKRNANVIPHHAIVTREERIRVMGQKSAVLWFTGLSGSGKSTIANAVEFALARAGRLSYLLDGDNVRLGLNADLGFSAQDRKENNRRVSQVAKLFWDANVITLVSFISPFREERDAARKLLGEDFVEIHVDTPLEVCERRDPKGLYSKARRGEIQEFTGISSPYEPPLHPELTLHTEGDSVELSAEKVLTYLKSRGYA